MEKKAPFWRITPVHELDDAQWESLCDGCGRCCLQKLQDVDTGTTYFSRVACRLLDTQSCRCSDYANRFAQVPDCTAVRPLDAEKRKWLPPSCAYVKVSAGEELPAWHHLRCGDPDAVHTAGISVRGWSVPEEGVAEEDYEYLLVAFDEDDQPVFS
ncbi:YcgN family cysteine cluster protein [Granulosicoccaceae sp. 1_MG-2023]|nr:YcgN family cysteine cluster protein [Granulosicoccaceae sp. 1_MG-2023]